MQPMERATNGKTHDYVDSYEVLPPSYFPEKIAEIACLSANSTEVLAMIDEGNS